MKVAILAAGRGLRLGKLTREVPKCLLKIEGETLLERTVRILKEFLLDDVTIVIGKNGNCWSDENVTLIKRRVPHIVENLINDVTYSGYSCALAMEAMEPQTILVIDGDLIFKKEALKTLLSEEGTCLLTRPVAFPNEKGGKIKAEGKRVVYAGRNDPKSLPWDLYSGMMKISEEDFNELEKLWKQYQDKEILYVINILAQKKPIYITRIGYDFHHEGGGGSKITFTERVRKESITERKVKLAAEIKFLREIPDKWRIHFPEVSYARISEKKVFYEMPKYELPSLRRLLFSGVVTHKEALKWLNRVLSFSFEMYETEKREVPEDYMDFMHVERVWKRLQETYDKSPVFRKIIPKTTLSINGQRYRNIPLALSALIKQAKLLRSCLPPYVTHWGHFDLHFANIFIDLESNNFILIDPRGYEYCDFYYDLGKLWHSVNGKYDFVAERRFTLSGRKFEIERNGVCFEYEKIKGKLPSLFTKYSKESREDVMRKVEFAEAMHFSSLMPFFFDYDKKEYRAIAAYYTGVMLLNKFNEKYLKDYAEIDWININYPKDWKLAGEKEWRLI